jgi:hypothetical protein
MLLTTLASIPVETSDQGSGVERQVVTSVTIVQGSTSGDLASTRYLWDAQWGSFAASTRTLSPRLECLTPGASPFPVSKASFWESTESHT